MQILGRNFSKQFKIVLGLVNLSYSATGHVTSQPTSHSLWIVNDFVVEIARSGAVWMKSGRNKYRLTADRNVDLSWAYCLLDDCLGEK